MGQCYSKKEQSVLKVPATYIIKKEDKEQIASIVRESNGTYYYEYGMFSHHEGHCYRNEIRELTPSEKELHKDGKIYSLPQEFYQSAPVE